MDFTNNLSQIAGKLTADLTERTRKKERNELTMIHRVFIHQGSHGRSTGFSPFKITHGPLFKPPSNNHHPHPFVRRFKCINGPEPSWMILALSLMKTLCGWIPVQ